MKKLIENLLELQSLEFAGTKSAGTRKRIAELRAEIPLQILGHFDRLLARGKKGVSVIHHQVCSACHVQVPRNAVLTLMHGDDIQICENCGRYLCLPEHTGEKTADPAQTECPVTSPASAKPPKKRRAATAPVTALN